MKKSIFAILIAFSAMCAYSQKIAIFEFPCYDNDGKTIASLKKVNVDVEKQLNGKWFDNRIGFVSFSSQKTGAVQSSFDALQACKINDLQYAIYGYIKKTEVNFFAELKIFDSSSSKVLYTVFESDDLNSYERFVTSISNKIAQYFINKFEIKTMQEIKEEVHPLQFDLPFSLNYWAPIGKDWTSVLIGVIGVNAAVDFYPEFKVWVKRNRKLDLDFRLELGYKFGIGNPELYQAFYHSLSVAAPCVLNYHLNEKNILSAGIGPLYQFNYAKIQPKYEQSGDYFTNEAGIMFLFEYSYKLDQKWKLFFEIEGDVYFSQKSFFQLKPKIGAVWNFYKRDVQ